MFGALVKISDANTDAGYGLLTNDHSASSYGLPVFVPLDRHYVPTGEPARGSAEVGLLISCGHVGEWPFKGSTHVGWSQELSDSVIAAGFKFATN